MLLGAATGPGSAVVASSASLMLWGNGAVFEGGNERRHSSSGSLDSGLRPAAPSPAAAHVVHGPGSPRAAVRQQSLKIVASASASGPASRALAGVAASTRLKRGAPRSA
jgi:hypothetical protein